MLTAGRFSGRVLDAGPEGEGRPIAGAHVQLFLGGPVIEVPTAADGSFSFDHAGGSGDVVVAAAGYATTQIAGWDGADDLSLHLAAALHAPSRADAEIRVSGRVLDENGDPAPGVIVIGSDGVSASFGPFVTDEFGGYAGFAHSFAGPAPTGLAVWAYRRTSEGDVVALGLTSGVAIGEGATPAEVRLTPRVGEFELAPQTPDGLRRAAVVAEAPNGATVVLRTWEPSESIGAAPFFQVPGATITARVQVDTPDGAAHSEWREAVTSIDPVSPVLLPFPSAPVGPLAEGRELRWAEVPGATAYRLSAHVPGSGAPVWEALTAVPGLSPRGLAGVSAQTLQLSALAGPTASVRALAGVAGPRRLRLDAPSTGGLRAFRTVSL